MYQLTVTTWYRSYLWQHSSGWTMWLPYNTSRSKYSYPLMIPRDTYKYVVLMMAASPINSFGDPTSQLLPLFWCVLGPLLSRAGFPLLTTDGFLSSSLSIKKPSLSFLSVLGLPATLAWSIEILVISAQTFALIPLLACFKISPFCSVIMEQHSSAEYWWYSLFPLKVPGKSFANLAYFLWCFSGTKYNSYLLGFVLMAAIWFDNMSHLMPFKRWLTLSCHPNLDTHSHIEVNKKNGFTKKKFKKMKNLIACNFVLAYLNFKPLYDLCIDASDNKLDIGIIQNSRLIAFFSRKLNSRQWKCTIT